MKLSSTSVRALSRPRRLHQRWTSPSPSSSPSSHFLDCSPPLLYRCLSTAGHSQAELKQENRQLRRARIVPASPSYFTGVPRFTDGFLALQALVRKFQTLPWLPPAKAQHVAWKSLPQIRQMVGEDVRASKYQSMVGVLRRLSQIHPSAMPEEVREAIEPYKRLTQPSDDQAKPLTIDQYGRARAVGRRKSATARVWLVEGDGEVLVNGKALQGTFERLHDRESAIWPLKATGRVSKYNVWALVTGGGSTGQAEAMTLGLAKALLVHEPALKPALRRAGVITRDPRRVERKKAGKLKARKMPAWVKR